MGADDTERTMIIMGCCGSARKSGQTTEYLVKFRDGTTAIAKDIPTAKRMLALSSGGTYVAQAKPKE